MKVFLSSTYSDLREHRRQVLYMVDRFRHGGADWEWFGMEAFGARDDLPIDACLKFVDECDLYVGLFGVRYGSRDEKSGLSMTEVEYRRAVTKNKRRLIFLIDQTNAKVAPKDFEESAEGREKLKRLIDDVRKDRVTDSFGTPEDLGTKVVIALATHYLEVQKAKVGTKQDDPLMLMAAFGHEVRNGIAVIRMLLKLVRDEKDEPDLMRALLPVASNQADYIAQLANKMMQYADRLGRRSE